MRDYKSPERFEEIATLLDQATPLMQPQLKNIIAARATDANDPRYPTAFIASSSAYILVGEPSFFTSPESFEAACPIIQRLRELAFELFQHDPATHIGRTDSPIIEVSRHIHRYCKQTIPESTRTALEAISLEMTRDPAELVLEIVPIIETWCGTATNDDLGLQEDTDRYRARNLLVACNSAENQIAVRRVHEVVEALSDKTKHRRTCDATPGRDEVYEELIDVLTELEDDFPIHTMTSVGYKFKRFKELLPPIQHESCMAQTAIAHLNAMSELHDWLDNGDITPVVQELTALRNHLDAIAAKYQPIYERFGFAPFKTATFPVETVQQSYQWN